MCAFNDVEILTRGSAFWTIAADRVNSGYIAPKMRNRYSIRSILLLFANTEVGNVMANKPNCPCTRMVMDGLSLSTY